MPEPILNRAIWFGGIFGATWLAFSVGNLLLGGVSAETARNETLVIFGIAWGLSAWRRDSWYP